jgi:conjugal transfer/entry exclusion protein
MNITSNEGTLSINDVRNYRQKLDNLEALMNKREEIKTRINEINSMLTQILGADLFKKVEAESQAKKTKRTRSRDSMESRIKQVCDLHPNGATLEDFASGLGVAKVTASTYLYCQASHLVNRSHNGSKTVWSFKG